MNGEPATEWQRLVLWIMAARLMLGPKVVNPGWRPSGDGWTVDLLHRCTRCERESRHPTRLDRLHYVCDCGPCRLAVGLEHSVKLVVDPRAFQPVSLN